MGGISCPPALIHGISPEHGQRIMLIHLTTDRLCQWHPYDKTLHSLNCKYCIVDRKTQELKELFGSCEHSYGHWIDISLPHGRYPLYQLLRRFADVAPPQARDIAPLRLPPLLRHLHLSAQVPVHGGAPPSRTNPTSSPPSREPSNSCYPGSARRDESISDSDPKRSPYLLVLRRSPWKDLPHPSLLKRARAPSVRVPLAFSRNLLKSLLAGFLLLFLILDDVHLVPIHPRISSLSRLTGCASTPTPLGAPPLVVWLGLTTSWRRTTERKLRGF